MRSLKADVRRLIGSEVGEKVRARVAEFSKAGEDGSCFNELCFCILTANYAAEPAIRIQDAVGDGFSNLSCTELSARLKSLGYRFPNVRAKYIVEARKHSDSLEHTVSSFEDQRSLRDYLAANVKGLGMKEASHFLRNIGFFDVAIIDFHIVDLLEKNGLIERPKTLTPKRYRMIEEVLSSLARDLGLSLGELDLYLWYLETGKILK